MIESSPVSYEVTAIPTNATVEGIEHAVRQTLAQATVQGGRLALKLEVDREIKFGEDIRIQRTPLLITEIPVAAPKSKLRLSSRSQYSSKPRSARR